MSIPYFGRAYKLIIKTKAGDEITIASSAWEPEALRIVFIAEQIAVASRWLADITIYNLTAATGRAIGADDPTAQTGKYGDFNTSIEKDDDVILSAGYQYNFDAASSIIYTGKVFQPMWEREGATDNKLTLRCYLGLWEDEQKYVNLTLPAGSTDLAGVQQVAAQAEIPIEYLDTDTLSTRKLPRAKVVSGRPRLYFDRVAISNKLQCWMGRAGLNIAPLAPTSTTPEIVYRPLSAASANTPATQAVKQTVIGSPQQTEDGVVFRVLMDTQARLRQLIRLDMSVVRLQAKAQGQSSPSRLDTDQLYVISGIRYIGDTRGDAWYAEIHGVTRQWSQIYRGLR